MASSTFTFDVSEDVTFESTRNLISKRSDLLIFNAVLTLLPDLSAKLSTQRSFAHVFAPNDDAFVAFLTDIAPWDGAIDLRHIGNMTRIISALSKVSSLWNAVDSLPSFEQLISYHILGTARSYTSLPKDRRLGTLFPNASVSLSDKGVTDSDESRGISQHIATFATQNGHVSVLRGVLSPFNTAVARAMLINSMQQEQTKPTSTPVETIIGDEPACFPGDSVARTQGGEVKMRHLEAGMALYTGDKQQKTSPIYLFTHRLQDETLREFVRVTTRNRNVTLTAGHYLYVNGRLTAAGATKRGDWIRTDVGRRRVIKVQRVWRRGLYAPHTMQGDLIVDGVVVSCYSTAVAPWFAHAVLAPVRMAARCGWKEPLGGLLYVGAEVWRTVLPRGRL